MTDNLLSGMDRLLAHPEKYLTGKTIGLIVNHTSLAGDGKHSIAHFKDHSAFPLKTLFAPEHGLYGIAQDMIHIADEVDPLSGLTIKSLYGKNADSLHPDPKLLDGIDNLVFDIQDVGARYYTYIYTLANCMAICKQAGVRMVVCDRPNPINGVSIEGNLVGEAWRSFVGQYPLPNRHGMTAGELALYFNEEIQCDLQVVTLTGWKREMWYDQTGLVWTPPSPNMPTLATATVYPGMCMIEGTLLSEGRGTTLPFEQIGAPFIDPHKLIARLEKDTSLLPGVFFRPQYFQPMFQKCARETCGGVQFHVTDRNQFKPLLTTLALIRAIAEIYPDELQWRTEPYEYVSDRLAIDLLYGNPKLRETIFADDFSLTGLEESWQEELDGFNKEVRENYRLYT